MTNKYYFSGQLLLSTADLNRMNYGVFDTATSYVKFDSISDILDMISQLESKPQISVHIKNKNNNHKISRKGILQLDKDKYGVTDYFIDDFPLGLYLFELTNNMIDIMIEYTEGKRINENRTK